MSGLHDIGIMVVSGHDATGIGSIDALLHEIVALLDELLVSGETGSIDLKSLPLSPSDYRRLRELLAPGEVSATLNALGQSIIEETAYSGVWWASHYNSNDELVAEQIEVTFFPEILKSDPADARNAAVRLRQHLADSSH